MTRDQMIELVARVDFEFMGRQNWNAFDKYDRFAQLIAEVEREECAEIVDEWANGLSGEPEMFEIAKEIRARGQE